MKKVKKIKLPNPTCSDGYTQEQLDEILGDRKQEFGRWMSGQTVSLCNGREYDFAQKKYVETGHAHGAVIYKDDLERFLDGRPIID